MSWVNYHSHTLYCDGKAAPEDFIRSAVEKGFSAYGFSSHSPVPFASAWNMVAANLPEYLNRLTQLKTAFKGTIEIYVGLEIDYIEGVCGYRASGLDRHALDYVIGSVHYIGQLPDGSHFCFDGHPEAFFSQVDLLFHHDFRKVITTYYQSVMRMVEVDQPDIVGHLDKIKMHHSFRPYLNETDNWYVALVEETLEVIRQKGCMIEVNTRGLYKHNPPLLYPGFWILKRIFEKGIPVMINSDAHHPDEVGLGFDHAAALLHDIGFKTVRVLLNGCWQEKAFNGNGVIL